MGRLDRTAPHILIFEPKAQGHTVEWLEHLLRHVEEQRRALNITLVVAPELASALSLPPTRQNSCGIRVMPLSDRVVGLCMHRRPVVSGFARWWFVRHYLVKTRSQHALCLELDHLTLPLALQLSTRGKLLSGILFRPSVHYPKTERIGRNLRESVRDFAKDTLYRLAVRNRGVHRVLSLDPYFPLYAAARYAQGYKVSAIPDPAYPIERAKIENDVHVNRIPTGRTVFLLFGVLTERKGILKVLDALDRIPPEDAKRIAVIAAGSLDPRLASEVARRIDQFARGRCRDRWFELENRRLETSELVALVRKSDVVLAPYQRFVGSSGIVLWAAAAGKPVIGQDYGLLGRLVRENHLGLAVDTTNETCLAQAMVAMARNGPMSYADPRSITRFAKEHSPEVFSRSVFDAVSAPAPATPRTGNLIGKTIA